MTKLWNCMYIAILFLSPAAPSVESCSLKDSTIVTFIGKITIVSFIFVISQLNVQSVKYRKSRNSIHECLASS